MFLKKVLNQPNLVGTVMIVLLFGAGFVYAFAFDGFNVETATQGDVEAWLAAAGGGNNDYDDPEPCDCMSIYKTYDGCSTDLCDTSESDNPCEDTEASCSDNCAYKNKCSTCSISDEENIKCVNEGELCGDKPESCGKPNDPMDDDTRDGNS